MFYSRFQRQGSNVLWYYVSYSLKTSSPVLRQVYKTGFDCFMALCVSWILCPQRGFTCLTTGSGNTREQFVAVPIVSWPVRRARQCLGLHLSIVWLPRRVPTDRHQPSLSLPGDRWLSKTAAFYWGRVRRRWVGVEVGVGGEGGRSRSGRGIAGSGLRVGY